MKRAPRIDNYDLSRTPHRLRFNRHAKIHITEQRRLLKSTGRHEYRQKARKNLMRVPASAPPTQPVQSDPKQPNSSNPHRHS
jgi:hypothetical protein